MYRNKYVAVFVFLLLKQWMAGHSFPLHRQMSESLFEMTIDNITHEEDSRSENGGIIQLPYNFKR